MGCKLHQMERELSCYRMQIRTLAHWAFLPAQLNVTDWHIEFVADHRQRTDHKISLEADVNHHQGWSVPAMECCQQSAYMLLDPVTVARPNLVVLSDHAITSLLCALPRHGEHMPLQLWL